MTAAAFISADGGNISNELRQLSYITEFGVMAVMNRPYLGYGEILRMRHARFMVEAYHNRKNSNNWDAWAKAEPEKAQILFDGQRLAKDLFGWE